VIAAVNDLLQSDTCDCLGLDEDLIFLDENLGSYRCGSMPEHTCDEGDICANIAQFCAVFVTAVKPDVDTDGDGEPESISLSVRAELVGTAILGFDGEVPDPAECDERNVFHRGDTSDDGTMDLSDGVAILGFLFLGSSAPGCLETADVNNSGGVDISDGIAVLNNLFLSGAPPEDPGTPPAPCGPDPDEPGSAGDIGCDADSSCD